MTSRYFEGVIQGDRIYERYYKDDPILVGVTLDAHTRLEKEHDALIASYNEYQKVLMQHNLLPASPEDQIKRLVSVTAQQAEQIAEMSKNLSALMEKINGAS